MRIRMLVEKTGPRHDYRSWPGPGGEIDVPDEEGAALCAHGDAAPVAQPDADVETRAEPPAKPSAPAAGDPKSTWVDHAVSLGVPQADADAMTKQQLIAQYGQRM